LFQIRAAKNGLLVGEQKQINQEKQYHMHDEEKKLAINTLHTVKGYLCWI
jgi:hypothetical protein